MSAGPSAHLWQKEFKTEILRLSLENAPKEKIFLAPEEILAGKDFLEGIWANFSRETFDHLDESYLKTFDHTEAFKKMKLPILNIYGENDVRCPRRISEFFLNVNSNVTNVEIPNGGHFPFLMPQNRKMIIYTLEFHCAKIPR